MTPNTRRRLLTTGMAAALLAASGVTASAGLRSGGRLRVGVSGGMPSDTWDARRPQGLFMRVAAQGAVFDTLTEIGADGALKGELATAWQGSPDAAEWVFDLRKGVRFHNGQSFAAEDVIASIMLHKAADGSPAGPLAKQIAEVVAVSAHRVTFRLTGPNPDFPYLLSDPALLIYPHADIAGAMRNGIGTGLYQVEDFAPGDRFLARRVRQHYKNGQAGWFDQVELLALETAQARFEALTAGRVDVVDDLTPALWSAAAGKRRLSAQRSAGAQHYRIALRGFSEPAQALAVRDGLRRSLDRSALVARVFGGHARPGHDLPFLGSGTARIPGSGTPDMASFAALPLTVAPGLSETAVDLAHSLVSSARSNGLELRLEAAEQSKPHLRIERSYGRPTEDWALAETDDLGGPVWSTPRLEPMIAAARSALSVPERAAAYRDVERRIAADLPVIVPVFADYLEATSNRFARPRTIGKNAPLDDGRLAERWAMA